jgi:hypothetical protein
MEFVDSFAKPIAAGVIGGLIIGPSKPIVGSSWTRDEITEGIALDNPWRGILVDCVLQGHSSSTSVPSSAFMESLCIYGLVISKPISEVPVVSRCLSAGMSRC